MYTPLNQSLRFFFVCLRKHFSSGSRLGRFENVNETQQKSNFSYTRYGLLKDLDKDCSSVISQCQDWDTDLSYQSRSFDAETNIKAVRTTEDKNNKIGLRLKTKEFCESNIETRLISIVSKPIKLWLWLWLLCLNLTLILPCPCISTLPCLCLNLALTSPWPWSCLDLTLTLSWHCLDLALTLP